MVNVIIAGSRDFTDEKFLFNRVGDWVRALPLGVHHQDITVFCGGADGADALGLAWARFNGCAVAHYPAKWRDHGKAAGPIRNAEMADDAEILIAFWDGKSKGTRNMIDTALKKGLEVHVYRV